MRYQERMEKYDELERKIKHRYKKTKIRYKEDYLLWHLIPKGLSWGLTFWNTIWIPRRTYNIPTLAHEYAHLHRMNKIGRLKFLFLYTIPQILSLPFLLIAAVLAFLSVGNYVLIPLIAGLVFLLPWGSKRRMELEAEGYMVNLAVEKWKTGKITKHLQKFIVDSLVSWLYYKMTWERKEATELVERMTKQVNENPEKLLENEAYKDIYETLHNVQT